MVTSFRRNKAKAKAKARQTVAVQQDRSPSAGTFFSLPGEVRNSIYELNAQDVKFHLFNPKSSTSRKASPTALGLLLVSKQCRAEYLSTLLNIAPIEATITNLDFSDLQRVLERLKSAEVRALRANANLTVHLHLRSLNADIVPRLRKWCIASAGNFGRLPWRYVLDEEVKTNFTHARVVWCAERLKAVHDRLEEADQKRELRPILALMMAEKQDGVQRRAARQQGYGDAWVYVTANRPFPGASS